MAIRKFVGSWMHLQPFQAEKLGIGGAPKGFLATALKAFGMNIENFAHVSFDASLSID